MFKGALCGYLMVSMLDPEPEVRAGKSSFSSYHGEITKFVSLNCTSVNPQLVKVP